MLGNKVQKHSSFVRKDRDISPIIITQPSHLCPLHYRGVIPTSPIGLMGWVNLMCIKLRDLIYGESVCVKRPITRV